MKFWKCIKKLFSSDDIVEYPKMSQQDFLELVEADIWMLKTFLEETEETVITRGEDQQMPDGTVLKTINFAETLGQGDINRVVDAFREALIPACFVFAQKIYAEIFRLTLGYNNVGCGGKQVHIEDEVKAELKHGLRDFTPFVDQADLDSWFNGQYQFKILRQARNRVIHNDYDYDNGVLQVNTAGSHIFKWTSQQVKQYCADVIDIHDRIVSI